MAELICLCWRLLLHCHLDALHIRYTPQYSNYVCTSYYLFLIVCCGNWRLQRNKKKKEKISTWLGQQSINTHTPANEMACEKILRNICNRSNAMQFSLILLGFVASSILFICKKHWSLSFVNFKLAKLFGRLLRVINFFCLYLIFHSFLLISKHY